MPLIARALPGLFPPLPRDIDTSVRRILLSLAALVAICGTASYLWLSRDPVLGGAIVIALAGSLLAMAVPWHRFDRDLFGLYGVAVTLWIAWFVYLTRGGDSPFAPLTFLSVIIAAVPLQRRLGTTLGLFAAATDSLPLIYGPSDPSHVTEILTRTSVRAIAAVFLPWLMEEVRRAIVVARVDREKLETEQEISHELRRAQSQGREYLSVLAHELRNPLNSIGAAARVLAKDISGHPGEQTAKGIATEAHHAMELLDGLTDVASLESGRMRLALRPIDLAAVLRETANGMANGHGITVRGVEYPTVVLGDDRRLGQVVRNLISNAAKYSPPSSEIHVSLGISADRRNAIVQVRDQGPGIPPSERSRLFEKFARLSTAGATRGSGLGLFISRGIVHDHGGELWADWPAGGGTVFSFSVPLTGEERSKTPSVQ